MVTPSREDRRPRQVLVIGGTSGIGRATVERFARGGDRVWFTYRSERRDALDLVAELSAYGWQAEAFEFDQGNWASHECLLLQLPGPVEVLVNNAAAGYRTIDDGVSGPEYRREAALLWINSAGPLWLIRQLLPGMLDQGHGTIVNISGRDSGGTVLPDLQVADGMSKAALTYLTRHLAEELAHQSIGVFAICAGPPLGRLTRPAEIAEVVWWLASDVADTPQGTIVDTPIDLDTHLGLLDNWTANGTAEHRSK